ncbi:NTP transferase domain-containing protein [Kluyvera genomosp. 1]|uniref:NTP transferase domain-containing protein n=1 Tax=Kluyvera genomosp. 1 TaxID=2774053 RepID=UPI00092D41B3|nr:NTP transferase domain-containing protein [Kluyvera genomosp. 1]
MTQVECIITAAGLSSRMGQWKMMLPCQEGTILDTSIRNAQSFCSHIILVCGYRHQELVERYYERAGITIVYNPNYEQGLLSSVQAGAQALTQDYCFITHGDLPFLTSPIFHSLWLQRIKGSLLPEYQGIPGHPILVARQTLLHCLQHGQGHSVRQRLLADKHLRLPIDYSDILFDIDTPEDFLRLQRRLNIRLSS